MAKTTELDRARKKYTRRKTIGRLLTVLLASVIAVIAYSLRFDITSQGIGVLLSDAVALLVDNTGYPVTLESQPVQLIAVGSRAAVLTGQALSVYNAAGNQVVFQRTAGQNTLAAAAGKYLMTYTRGGYELSVRSGGAVLFHNRFQYPIYTAAISEGGACAVATAAQGDQAQVTVFDASGEQQFVWVSSERLVMALALDPEGKSLAVGGVLSDAGMLSSNICVFTISSGEERFSSELPDELLLSLRLLDGGAVTAVTDRAVHTLEASGGESGAYQMDGEPLAAFAVRADGSAALALGDYTSSHQMKLVLLDQTAGERASTVIDRRVQSLHFYGEDLIAFIGDRVVRYTASLEKVATTETPDALHAAVVGDDLYYVTMQQLSRGVIR